MKKHCLSESSKDDGYGSDIHLEDPQATLANNVITSNVISGSNSEGGGAGLQGGQATLIGKVIAL
jgi:hypothetical protein